MATDDLRRSFRWWRVGGSAVGVVACVVCGRVGPRPETPMNVDLQVIEGGGEDAAPVVNRPRTRFCRHHRFQLDGGARRVYCGDCEQEIDAFDALGILAAMFEQVNGRYKAAISETKRTEASLAELKRQERNAKARVRRAS